ncbi:MAG: ribonuclease III [Clostridia bacterium]|nr:ribonuclease III [Clostridia bacterium]
MGNDNSTLLLGSGCDPKQCGSDVLAFVGDGVFGLLVREYLASQSNAHAAQQHSRAVAMVRCEAQAEYMKRLLPHLTEEEEGVFRRGRNYHTSHSPRKSTAAYHSATGLEALFGYLYLSGSTERIRELFEYCKDETVPEE